MNKYKVGDRVVCKAGGPVMVINAVPAAAPAYNAYVVGGNVDYFGNGIQVANPNPGWYTCTWWNAVTQTFNQWNFQEELLEDEPSN